MAADGSIVIDVNLNDTTARNGINNLGNQATKTTGVFSGLGKAIAAVGAVVIGAKALSSLKDFTVSSVQAAASAQALNSQFSQVFGTLEKDATQALQNISDETNILPERLQASFTQIAAFAKTAGFDTQQALELSSRATLAAADSAAFYDRSIESVTETLQSYLKGNYANDAALGISSTETTRNAKANELYGKSFNNLSEAQKQLTLLKQVEDANALSGALGQAAREGDQFENVTGNLAQAWQNFKVAIGGNFLDLAVNGVIGLTNAIRNVNVDSISAVLTTIVSRITEIAQVVIPILIQAFNFVREAISQVISFVIPIIENLREAWESNSTSIFSTVSTIFNNIRNVIETVVTAVLDFVRPQLEQLRNFWDQNGAQILQAVSNAFNAIKAVIDFVMPAILLVIRIVWEAIQDVISGALNVIMGLVKVFSGIFTGDFSKLWEGIKQIFFGAIDLILGVLTLTFFGGIRTILTNLAKTGLSLIKGLWDDALNLFRNFVNGGVSTISNFVSNVVNFFRTLAARILTNILEIRRDGVKYFTDLASGAINALINLPARFLQIGKNIIASLINGLKSLNPVGVIVNIGESILGGLKSVFGGTKASAQVGEDIPTGLGDGIKKASPKALAAFSEFKDEYVAIGEDLVVKQQKSSLDDVKGLEATEKKKKSTREKANKDTKTASEKYLEEISDRIKKGRELGTISVADEAKMWKDSLSALTVGSNEYLEARNNYQAAVIEGFEQKKKAGLVSLSDEANFWKGLLDNFTVGSDQYVEANEKYRDTISKINDAVVKTNEDFAKRVSEVNTRLVQEEQKLTDAYNKAYDDRYNKLLQFSGLFDEFGIDTKVTGQGLLTNLNQQVQGFEFWQENITSLSKRAIDDGLLAELRAAGPQALSQLVALNSLTDEQLKQYSDLYLQRSRLAREQTDKELTELRKQTEGNINRLQIRSRVQLDEIQQDWTKAIANIVNGTEEGFSGLEDVGRNAGLNLYNGLSSVESSLIAKARSIASSVQAALASALNVSTSSINVNGLTAPSSVGNASSSSISNNNKTQVNNITVQSNDQATAMQREVRKLNFGF